MPTSVAEDVRARVDALEEGYEFLLSYAARGLPGDGGAGSEVRRRLDAMADALDGLVDAYRQAVDDGALGPTDRAGEFLDVMDLDARRARAAVRLVLGQTAIGSQLVDNLNASLHVRTLLTDVFLVDEVLEPEAARRAATAERDT